MLSFIFFYSSSLQVVPILHYVISFLQLISLSPLHPLHPSLISFLPTVFIISSLSPFILPSTISFLFPSFLPFCLHYQPLTLKGIRHQHKLSIWQLKHICFHVINVGRKLNPAVSFMYIPSFNQKHHKFSNFSICTTFIFPSFRASPATYSASYQFPFGILSSLPPSRHPPSVSSSSSSSVFRFLILCS